MVTKSTRPLTKRMRSLLRKPLGRSARCVLSQPAPRIITHRYPPLFSALLLPNRRSQLRRLREISPHHPRNRLPSPSKRMIMSNHPGSYAFCTHHFFSRFMLFMVRQVHTTLSRYLFTSDDMRLYSCSFKVTLYTTNRYHR